MSGFKFVFWTTVFWLFVFITGIAYVRIFDMSLISYVFPVESGENNVQNETIVSGLGSEISPQLDDLLDIVSRQNEQLQDIQSVLDSLVNDNTSQSTNESTQDTQSGSQSNEDETETTNDEEGNDTAEIETMTGEVAETETADRVEETTSN